MFRPSGWDLADDDEAGGDEVGGKAALIVMIALGVLFRFLVF